MRRPLKLLLIVLLVSLLLSYTPLGNSETTPLQQLTLKPIPVNLPYYIVAFWGDDRPSATSGPASVVFPSVFVDILNEISSIYPQATVGGGDFVSFGTLDQYKAFYGLVVQARFENFIPVVGNHDEAYGGQSWGYYTTYIGNTTTLFDNITGWRLVALNDEGSIDELNQGLTLASTNLGNRSLILSFHRPLYPYVAHNMQDEEPDKASLILNFISNLTTPPRIVLQSHWHGYAENITANTAWIISGGAGAPLYQCPSPTTTFCLPTYNYVILVLYPNGNFTLIPLRAGPGAGNLTVKVVDSTFLVYNNKVNVYGNYTDVPVRLAWRGSGFSVYLVGFARANSTSYASLDPGSRVIETNLSNAYVYIQYSDNPLKATVIPVVNGVADLSSLGNFSVEAEAPPTVVQQIPTTTTPPQTTTTRATTTTASRTTPPATTTTTSASPTTPATTTSTTTLTTQSTTSTTTSMQQPTGAGLSLGIVGAIVAIVVIVVALAIMLIRKR
ncbi:MAG: hypothetical protein JHC12_01915 [Thermogladius sp.]|nr:hypothetical protein [Thermogladius sp.]